MKGQNPDFRYRELVERLPVAAYLLDADRPGGVRWVSPQIEAMLGYPAEEFVGTALFGERIHPGDRQRIWDAMKERFRHGAPYWEQEYRMLARDGREIWVLDRDTGTSLDADGDDRLAAGALVDITALKRAEAGLDVRGRTAEEVVSTLADAVVVFDAGGRVVLVNDAAVQLIGVPRAELLDSAAGDVPMTLRFENGDRIGPSNSPGRRVLETGEGLREVTVCIERPDGAEVWVGAAFIPLVRDEDAKPHGVVCSFHEITSRRRFAEALEESEERFRQLAENIGAVFWMRDVDTGRILYVSPGYDEIWGRPGQALYDDPNAWLEAVHPDDRERVSHTMEGPRLLDDGSYRIVRPNGDVRYIRDRGFPVRDERGRVYRVAGIAEDVTEQRATAAALREARELAHAAFEHAATGNIVFSIRAGEGNRPLEVNSAFRELIGHSEEELRRKDVNSLMHPDDVVAEWSDDWHRLIAGEIQTYQVERRLIHRDGHVIWALLALSVIRGESDEPLYGICQVQDISARKRGEAQQEAIARLGRHALAGAGTSDLMDEAVEVLARGLGVDFVTILEDMPVEDELVVRAAWGGPARTGERVPRAGGLAGRTLHSDGALTIEDWEEEAGPARGPALLLDHGPRSSMAVVLGEPESPWGILGVHTLDRRSFRAEEINFAQAVANVLATAIHRWSSEEEARERALHDPLTGLPNRTLFRDRLVHALERAGGRPGSVAVLLIDLDNFKHVNDSLGHEAGDDLLRSVAPRLRQSVKLTNTVARFGGDEFIVLCEDLRSDQDAVDVAERLMAIFAQPFTMGDRELFATGTIGVAVATGDANAEALIRDADAAMYRAKALGRGRWEMFDEALRKRVSQRLRTETALRRAVARDELRTFFQPIVSLDESCTIVGAEALLRWQDAEQGWVRPADFIPVAEDSGLIVTIGEWVLREACRCATEWRGPNGVPLNISVNLSVRQLTEPNFPSLVVEVLRETGIDPSRLGLEITESVLVEESDGPLDALNELKRLGVRLVLDDFGTGYSSLSYLNRLPIDVLKLDRSFVAQLDDTESGSSRAIVASVVGMAHALGLTVVGEGVETEAQRDHLRALGCELAQGFLFARPMAPDVLAGQLERLGTRG